jgi:hypothetical protein
MPVSDYDPIVDAASKEWDLDPNWMRSIMQGESAGSPVDKNGQPIRSSAGAGGLMQIMPATAQQLGVANIDDPVQNIWGGAKYLAQLRDRYNGNIQLATAAYNAGPNRVDAYINTGQPLPSETAAYVPKIASYYQGFAKRYQGSQPVMQATTTSPTPPAQAEVPSNDDFLKMTGGGKSAPAVPSNDDFLRMVSGGKQTPTAPSAPSPASQPGVANQNPSFEMQPDAAARAVNNPIAQAMVQGAQQGWEGTPDILSPQASAWLTAHGMGAIGNTTGLPSYALKALSAGGNALQSGIAQAGASAGVPLLGRDLAAFPEAFPTGIPEAGAALRGFADNPLVARPMTRPSPLAADVAPGGVVRDPVTGAAAPVGQPANALSTVSTVPHAAPAAPLTGGQPPVLRPTTVAPASPGPQSLGAAATPATFVNMTPAEALASRSTGEMQRVLEPAKPGIDTTIYVPGTQPTEAEVSGNPTVAAEQKFNRSRNPDPHIAQETANNAARVEYYEQTAGTPTQAERLKDARDQQAQADLRSAFGNKSAADAQPVVDTINGILSDPRLGERDAVLKFVAPYLDKLTNEDGTLKTDPEALYGIRENITDQLAKNGDPQNAGARQVRRQLMAVKGALDDAIEAAAPGYRQYLDNYSTASRPIEAMEYLQDARPSLTNAQGTMTPAAFDRFMKNTVADRAAGGISPAGALTDDQMGVLHDIHSDLKRFQNINLSNPRGSDTNMLGHLASKGGELAAHGLANYVSPVLGSVALQMGKNVLEKRRVERVTQRVLNPNPLKYPPSQGP